MPICIECNTFFECRRNERRPVCEEGNHCRCILCWVTDGYNVSRIRALYVINNCLPISEEEKESLATFCMVIKNDRKRRD